VTSPASPTVANPSPITVFASESAPTPSCLDSGFEFFQFNLNSGAIAANAASLTIVPLPANVANSEWTLTWSSLDGDVTAFLANWQVLSGDFPITSGTVSDKISWTAPSGVCE
jgi:hypothetical protein